MNWKAAILGQICGSLLGVIVMLFFVFLYLK